jgi:phospholipase/carboxylesterase
MAALDDLAHLLRPADGQPAGALVLMHGRGTSERDLFGLLDVLDPRARLVGACPRGPLTLPPGGYHWYVVPRVGFPDPATFHATFARLDAWLSALAEHTGVPPERTILGGFSQGAVMAWAMGAAQGRPRPAGILAMSGFIPTVDGFEIEASTLEGLPVAIAHGTHDPIIAVDFGHDARGRATQAGAHVLYRESPIGHTLDPKVLGELTDWVAAALPD